MPDNENRIYSDPETVLWWNAQPSENKNTYWHYWRNNIFMKLINEFSTDVKSNTTKTHLSYNQQPN